MSADTITTENRPKFFLPSSFDDTSSSNQSGTSFSQLLEVNQSLLTNDANTSSPQASPRIQNVSAHSSSVNEDNLTLSVGASDSMTSNFQSPDQESNSVEPSPDTRNASMKEDSLRYWNHINEVLNDKMWMRLEKTAMDLKNVADLLLTDNNCLSMGKYLRSYLAISFFFVIIFLCFLFSIIVNF